MKTESVHTNLIDLRKVCIHKDCAFEVSEIFAAILDF